MTGDNAMEIKHKKRKQRAASSTAKHNGGDDLDDFGLEIPDWVETSHEANEEDLKGDTKGGATQADDEQQKPKRRKVKFCAWRLLLSMLTLKTWNHETKLN